jgi:hypothetical protein
MHTLFQLKNLNIRDHLADVDEDDTLILEWGGAVVMLTGLKGLEIVLNYQ